MANGEDIYNIFSGDYWGPDAYQRRRSGQKQAAPKLAVEQDKSNRAPWEAFGSFLNDTGKNIGKVGQDINRGNQELSRGLNEALGFRKKEAPQAEVSSRDVGRRLTSPAEPLTGRIIPTEESAIDAIMRRLNEEYDGSPVGSENAAFEEILNQKLSAINGARGMAQDNFSKSDANVSAMHDAFKNEILGRAPQLQAQNKEFQGDITSTFDSVLGENNERAAADKRTNEEMYQRLGIAPAAAGPDLVGQAIAEGNNSLNQSKTARLSEAQTYGQTDLSRNTAAATAVGNDSVARRGELNLRLQDILGDLGSAETEARTSFLGQSSDANKEAEQRKYERFLTDRDFNMGLYDTVNGANLDQIKAQEKASSQSGGGIDALIATTNPQVVQGIQNLAATEKDLDLNNFADVSYRLRKNGVTINPTEVQVYLTKMKNLSKTNNVVPTEY